jgi:N utilization substance protein A
VNKIRLSKEEIQYITLFESMTGAKVRDCIEEEGLMGFVVQAGDMGLAIGKRGSTIERVRKAIGKSIWVVEYSDEADTFIRNMFHPVNVRIGRDKDSSRVVIEVSRSERNKVIGHEGRKIRMARQLVKRHCGIGELKLKTV